MLQGRGDKTGDRMCQNLKVALSAILALSASLLLLTAYVLISELEKPSVIGKVEAVGVEAIDTVVKARIDTGAAVTSLNARILEVTKSTAPDGPDKVRFEVKDDDGKRRILDKDVIEWQRIKNKGDNGYTRRPVVKLDLCLGGKEIHGRVNLVDRSNFKYQLLIGRNFLEASDFVVDARTELTRHRSKCK
jgi:hypothetical protein